MSSRKTLLQELGTLRNSKVITYLTGDRKPMTTKVAQDIIPLFREHLSKIGDQQKISLFLYTRGGDMIAPLRLVKLLREHCKYLEVLVPYMCHSAGTMICLGADSIVMSRMAELSPVDPSMGHPFNPVDPTNPQNRMELSVEDLNSFFLFAKEKVGVKNENVIELYKQLAEKVHPLALGSAYRAQRMAKMLAEKSLKLHIRNGWKIKKIVQAITSDICIHGYPITRDEAHDLGLPVEKPDSTLEGKMHDLLNEYQTVMELNKPFSPPEILRNNKGIIDYKGAFVESENLCHTFTFKGKVSEVIAEGKPAIGVAIDSQAWEVL